MEGLWEDIVQERQLRRRFCTQVFGGQHCIRTPKNIVKHVMCVREWVDHHEGMDFHYNLKYRFSHLKNGQLILWDQFSPREEN